MDGKENQRIALTKRMLAEALIKLLRKTSIHKIAIRDLCETAGINRSTFYNHYGSQYDVLKAVSQSFIADIAEALEEADVQDKDSVLGRVTLILNHIEGNIGLSKLLFNNNVDPSFSERLFSLPKIEDMLGNALTHIRDEYEKRAVIAFAIHGSYKILQDWINDNERPPAAEEARLIITLAGRVCKWEQCMD